MAPFGPKGGLLRALGGALRQPCPRDSSRSHNQTPQQLRSLCLGALGAGAVPALQSLAAKAGSRLLGGGAALIAGGTTAFALAQNYAPEEAQDLASDKVPWVSAIAVGVDVEEVQSPGQMLRRHPIGKLVVEQDHLFETMIQSNQIKEFRCFYDTKKQIFYSVVALGKEVCGFPQTVHGGLTAALVDETFGGLSVSIWRAGKLGFRPPAYTARLEVDYKQKIPAGSIILVSTEVEKVQDRKVWMRATVSNGKGKVYATSRALFVAPRFLPDWLGGGRR